MASLGRSVLVQRVTLLTSCEGLTGKLTGRSFDDALITTKRRSLTMGLLLLIILILFLIGGLPRWGYHSYGYGPSGVVGVLVIVFAVLLLTGRL